MCVRYYLDEEIDDETLEELLEQSLRIAAKLSAKIKVSGDIRPTDIAPVIAPSSRNRSVGAFPMQWGFTHPKRGMLVFNTRMETAKERDMLAGSVNDRRCLIPASGYYEWKKTDPRKKDRYAFRAEDGSPLYLAGLYIRTSDEHRLPCFTILTQDADRSIKELHPRMPVLVPYSRAEEWLSPDTDLLDMIQNLRVPIVPERLSGRGEA